jgi:hypothetical protein
MKFEELDRIYRSRMKRDRRDDDKEIRDERIVDLLHIHKSMSYEYFGATSQHSSKNSSGRQSSRVIGQTVNEGQTNSKHCWLFVCPSINNH